MNCREIHRRSGTLFSGLLAALLITGAGCRATAPQKKANAKAEERKGVVANRDQVRLRMRALVRPMCGELEQSADAIIAGTTNRTVQHAALRWKIEGVPALREALFQPDPITAASDTWVLCCQMADYFEKGPGRQALGAASTQAAATCRRMEEEFAQVAASVSKTGDVSKTRAFVRQWASEHPIGNSIAGRESTLSRVVEREIADSFSIGEAMAELTTTMDDLSRKLEIYSDQGFRQARWEAELFKLALRDELPLNQVILLAERATKSAEQILAPVERVAPALERVASFAQDLPKSLAAEREVAVKSMQDELARTLKFVQEERIATLEQVTRERIAAMKELREDLETERKLVARDVEQISLKVVDHAAWRVAQIVAATVAVLLLAAVAGFFLVRRMCFQ